MRTDRLGNWVPVWVVLILVPPAAAATVTFHIVPTAASGQDEVVVAPGAEVAYEITAAVASDDPLIADNNGLAFLSVSIETDLGVAQRAADEFDPLIAQAFTVAQSLGTPSDDDVLQIGGGQPPLTNGTTGIGVGGTQLLARGRLITPATEGVYTVLLTASANVFHAGSDISVRTADSVVASGFSLRVQEGAGADEEPAPPPPVGACGAGAAGMTATTLLVLTLGGCGFRRGRLRSPRAPSPSTPVRPPS